MLRRCALLLTWPLLLPWAILRAAFGFVAFCFFRDTTFVPKGQASLYIVEAARRPDRAREAAPAHYRHWHPG